MQRKSTKTWQSESLCLYCVNHVIRDRWLGTLHNNDDEALARCSMHIDTHGRRKCSSTFVKELRPGRLTYDWSCEIHIYRRQSSRGHGLCRRGRGLANLQPSIFVICSRELCRARCASSRELKSLEHLNSNRGIVGSNMMGVQAANVPSFTAPRPLLL